MNIYVGNLTKEVNQEDLKKAFEKYGRVATTKIIFDAESGESRGFGFVAMPAKNEAESAIRRLNGSTLKGQIIKVSEAKRRQNILNGQVTRGGKLTRGGGRR